MFAFLSKLLWSSPPLERSLVEVAREMRCLPDAAREGQR